VVVGAEAAEGAGETLTMAQGFLDQTLWP